MRNTSPTGLVTFLTTHSTHGSGPGGTAAAGAPIAAASASAGGSGGGAVSAFTTHPTTAPAIRPIRMRVCGTEADEAMWRPGLRWGRGREKRYPPGAAEASRAAPAAHSSFPRGVGGARSVRVRPPARR